MSETYFSKFNTITYANNLAVDITERAVVLNNTEKNPYIYYPTDLSQGVRADVVSYNNYNDPFASWVLYLNNNITDPYYEWYLSQSEFAEFIKTKYVTTERAMNKVIFYRNNWVDQDGISVAAYNALNTDQKPYWKPNYYNGGSIIDYSRSREDLISSTNFIIDLTCTNASNATFIKNEIVNIVYQPSTIGKGQVVQSNSTSLIVQHISGDAFPHDDVVINPGSYVYGTESQSNLAVTNCTFLANVISANVISYWSAVSYYDYENEKNEGNKTIKILQPTNVPAFINNFKKILGQ